MKTFCGAIASLLLLGGCHREEGLTPAELPDTIQGDYAVFSKRCSKCHSLSRPLNAGITDDAAWDLYVNRMRRQPQSGISMEDQAVILRFLHYYAAEQRKRKAGSDSASVSTAAAPPASSTPPSLAAPPATTAPAGGT